MKGRILTEFTCVKYLGLPVPCGPLAGDGESASWEQGVSLKCFSDIPDVTSVIQM